MLPRTSPQAFRRRCKMLPLWSPCLNLSAARSSMPSNTPKGTGPWQPTFWVQLETSYAATCAHAAAILSNESIDILLLDPDLPDHQGAEAFRLIQTAAPHVPIVLLVDPEGAALAERLVREGAQDFLLKP